MLNRRLRYFSIMLCCLLAVTVACNLSGIGRQIEVILVFAPDDSTATYSVSDFNTEVEVLEKRLDEAGISGKVATDGSTNIRVGLYNQNQEVVEMAIALATDTGMIFFESDESLAVGLLVPDNPNVVLDAYDIAEAYREPERMPGERSLSLTLTPDGETKLADYTAAHVGDYLAVAHNGRIIVNPRINQPITDGKAVIMVNLDGKMLYILAAEINGGPLPFDLTLIDQSSP